VSKGRSGPSVLFLAGVGLILVTRLPQFLGGNLVPDGDEAIVGLMAKHMSEGRGFPLFFYGQRYGLSLFEAGSAAIFFTIFGVSTWGLKAATLLLWSVGWAGHVAAAQRWLGRRAAVVCGLLLTFCPAWFAWSMKARGGYVTAFALSGWLLWRLAGLRSGPSRPASAFVVGAGLALVFFAQPTWLVGLVFFLPLLDLKVRRRGEYWGAAAGAGLTAALVLGVSSVQSTGDWRPLLFDSNRIIEGLMLLPGRLWVHLTGAYYMKVRTPVGRADDLSGWVWCALLAWALFAVAWARGSRRRYDFGQAAALASAAVLGFAAFISLTWFGHRHLLPLSGFMVLAVAGEMDRLWDKGPFWRRSLSLGLILVVGLASVAAWEFRRLSFFSPRLESVRGEERALEGLLSELEAKGVNHVYSLGPLLQWIITFSSGERVIARWVAPRDRYPAYPAAVDAALRDGAPVALIGEGFQRASVEPLLRRRGQEDAPPRSVANRYFVVHDPPAELIRALGFQLNEPTPREN